MAATDLLHSKRYKRGRILYHAEAALEYLIAILVQGAFLARLTASLGISDSLTGIISSFISLGCLFQLVSLFIRPARVKRLVTWASLINQIFFMLLYIFPIGDRIPQGAKIALFVVTIFIAYFIYNVVHPKKINWLMSLVSDAQRGRFTAIKEMISLVAGILFSFVMGQAVDYYEAIGDTRTMYIIGAVVILGLSILHTLTMIFTVEPETKSKDAPRLKEGLQRVWRDKSVRKVVVMFVLWNVAHYAAIPFYGSYMIKELGLSQAVIALVTAAGSIARIICSIPMGIYADKHSFAKMLRLCLGIVILAFGCAAVAAPGRGEVCILLYNLLHGVAMSGINSALTNLIFDYVPDSGRADALAVSQAGAGLMGFVCTLLISPLVTSIQNHGNTFLGLTLYAQQVTSLIAIGFTVLTVLYLHFFIIKKDTRK